MEIRSESGRDYPGDVVRRRWQHKGWIAEIWDIPVKPDNLEGKIKTDKTKNRTLVISWDFDKRYLELVDHFEVNVSFPEAIKAQLPMQVKADKPFEVVLPLADDFSGRMTFTVEPKHMQKHIINWKSFLKQPFDGSIQEPTEGIINIDLIEEIVVEEKASVEEKALVEVPKAEEERISWSSKQSLAILFLLIGVVLIGWGIFKKGSK